MTLLSWLLSVAHYLLTLPKHEPILPSDVVKSVLALMASCFLGCGILFIIFPQLVGSENTVDYLLNNDWTVILLMDIIIGGVSGVAISHNLIVQLDKITHQNNRKRAVTPDELSFTISKIDFQIKFLRSAVEEYGTYSNNEEIVHYLNNIESDLNTVQNKI